MQQSALGLDRGIQVAAKHRVTVNLADWEYRELSAFSDKHRVSLAWLGRQAIIEFLERYEKDELQLPLKLSSGRREAGGLSKGEAPWRRERRA